MVLAREHESMPLDVSTPDPPSLHGPQSRGDYEAIDDDLVEDSDDYRREELEDILAEGAWRDAFDEWSNQTALTPAEFEAVERLGLVDAFDFYWAPASDEVGYRAPSLPDDAAEEFDLDDPGGIDMALDTLGRIVSETLENDYLLRDEDEFGFFGDDEDVAYEDRDY